MAARVHTDLDVWKLADEVRRRTAQLTTAAVFENRDLWWLKDQMRRAAHSACSNIAEGFGRYNPRDFARFMRTSRASLVELDEHLREPAIAAAIPAADIHDLTNLINRAVRASARFIDYLTKCPPPATG